ncbi:MFS transporter [Brevibacterium limosum]|uniref:MFS transporter n=1 Tax=Brevibacterium limosum TaxID=2697565 RepID=UPI001AA184D5|nr:aromatic acid/H+ symport family MFS transporter [Brevibacterium limosum]
MRTIDAAAFIQNARPNRFHGWLLFWSCFIVLFDMYDLVIYGSVLPILIREWAIGPVEAGVIGSVGLFGMMIGAICFGFLADRFGRRRMLIASVLIFSLATFGCAFASAPEVFGALRAIAGVGIGGILPNIIAMITDYAPKRTANTMVAIVTCLFSVGGIVAAFAAMRLIPAFGWQSVYWVALIPVLTLPLSARWFFDSPTTLIRLGRTETLRTTLHRLAPTAGGLGNADLYMGSTEATAAPDTEPTARDSRRAHPRASLALIFGHGRGLATVMIWIAFFMCLLMVNGVTTWLPNLMMTAGYALDSSLTFMIVLNVGAIVGTLSLGRLADRIGTKRVLVPMFVIAAVSLVLLGVRADIVLLLLFVAIAGACTMGSQNISYAFVSQFYPSSVRSTALGLASGIGRAGAILGPTFGGFLQALELPVQSTFLFFAVPGLIAAAAFACVPLARATTPPRRSDPDLAPHRTVHPTTTPTDERASSHD